MARLDFHGALRQARARLANGAALDDGQAPKVERRFPRNRAIALAVIAGLAAVGIGGYEIGASRVGDADTAYEAGFAAGEERGAAVGERKGYESAFEPARERAFDEAYDAAYERAYRRAFESEDLSAPRTVKVVGP